MKVGWAEKVLGVQGWRLFMETVLSMRDDFFTGEELFYTILLSECFLKQSLLNKKEGLKRKFLKSYFIYW